jgi:hypothetical protein
VPPSGRPRSSIGQASASPPDGAEVYVGGPSLSVCTLGEILRAAGAVRGMALDIDPAWAIGTYFHDTLTGAPQGFRLYPAQQVPPQHYLSPSSRDWYARS